MVSFDSEFVNLREAQNSLVSEHVPCNFLHPCAGGTDDYGQYSASSALETYDIPTGGYDIPTSDGLEFSSTAYMNATGITSSGPALDLQVLISTPFLPIFLGVTYTCMHASMHFLREIMSICLTGRQQQRSSALHARLAWSIWGRQLLSGHAHLAQGGPGILRRDRRIIVWGQHLRGEFLRRWFGQHFEAF